MNEKYRNLDKIKVLYRRAGTLSLWGIPHDMRPGQQPSDLEKRDNWIWLGSPGWWGYLSQEEQMLVEAFLRTQRDNIPENPNEWTKVEK